MRRPLLTAVLLVAGPASATQAPPPAAAPQAPVPVFRERADLVVVDVVVADKQGNAVPGLRREDFTILDERQPQPIASFESVHLPPSPAGTAADALPPPRPRLTTNAVPADRAGRTFVVVFDNVHMSPLQARRAKAVVAAFLEKGVREGDRVSLLATGGGAWWNTRMLAGRPDLMALLKGLDGRRIRDITSREQITDFEALRVHLYQDTLVGQRVRRRFDQMGVVVKDSVRAQEAREIGLPGVNDLLVEARAAEVYRQARSRLLVTLGALERSLRSLSGSHGRKSLVLLSEGFVLDRTVEEFKTVLEAARRANVVVYFVDTRGLEGLSSAYSAEFGTSVDMRDFAAVMADASQDAAGAEMLAVDTGGFSFRNNNDVGGGLTRIADESRSYYLLGYVPPDSPRDGRFHAIQVKVGRKAVTVRARKGYYAPLDAPPGPDATVAFAMAPTPRPTPPPKEGPDRDLQEALDSPYPRDDVRLRMTAFVLDELLLGKARTLVAAEVDAANLDFMDSEGRLVDTLDVLIVAAQRETGEYQRHDQKLEMALQRETRERLRQTWWSIVQEFELPPGAYQAKIVARDGNSRRLGTLTYEFEVPELNPLRVSTPILTDTVRQLPGQPAPAPVLVARRRFPSGAKLYCQFDVYGAQKDKATGLPRVRASYLLLHKADGTVRDRGGPARAVPTSLGRISQLLWLPLKGAEPGDYELVLTVEDELTGQAREVREPFAVTWPPSGP
jgi:VWFA-related protein